MPASPHRSSHGARDILTWRAERAWQFREADRVLCPSHDVLARLQRHGLADQRRPRSARTGQASALAAARHRRAKASCGSPCSARWPITRAARTVAAVAEMADPKTIEIHLIGHTEGNFPKPALKRMKITGRYEEADAGRTDRDDRAACHLVSRGLAGDVQLHAERRDRRPGCRSPPRGSALSPNGWTAGPDLAGRHRDVARGLDQPVR